MCSATRVVLMLSIAVDAAATRLPPIKMMSMSPNARPSVLCVGETLFDGLPSGIFLGGAPLNVAVHLAECGVDAKFASAVGADRLGREAVRRLVSRGVDVHLVKTINDAETGFVEVDIDSQGDASYSFATPAAWDYLSDEGQALSSAAANADAIVFGTLSQRAAKSRDAVAAAKASARFTCCDVNLRPPFASLEIVAESAFGVDLLKLNDEEMVQVTEALRKHASDEPASLASAEAACAAAARCLCAETEEEEVTAVAKAAAAIGCAANAARVVVTRGSKGAVYWEKTSGARGEIAGSAWVCAGFVAPAIADTVGAGDAFLAGLLSRLLVDGASAPACLDAGCRLGAFVAGQSGATPPHDEEAIESLQACIVDGVGVTEGEVDEGCAVPAESFAVPIEIT